MLATANGAFFVARTPLTTTSATCCTFTVSMVFCAVTVCAESPQADISAMLIICFMLK